MSSSNAKSTRSRLPSPHRTSSSSAGPNRGGNVGSGGNGNSDGSRSVMQRWLEPPVQNKPSYQDAGLVRGGLFENMAPLGTMPKAGMLKKTPVSGESATPASASAVKRIVLKKPFSATASVPVSAPDTTPSTTETPPATTGMSRSDLLASVGETANVTRASMSPTSGLGLPIPVIDNMDDDDYVEYVPKRSKSRRTSQNPSQGNKSSGPTVTPVHSRRQSTRRRSVHSSPAPPLPHRDPTPGPTPASTSGASVASLARSSAAPGAQSRAQSREQSQVRSESSFLGQPGREPDDKDQADRIVEIAVDEALRHSRYPTAWALRLLYDERSSDPAFVCMIEDIYYQRATPKTIRKFFRLVEEKKKEGKKEDKGRDYFEPPSTGSKPLVHKPQPAPFQNLIKPDFGALLRRSVTDVEVENDADGHARKRRKTEPAEARTALVADQTDVKPDITVSATATVGTPVTNGIQGASSQKSKMVSYPHVPRPPGGVAKNKSPRGKKTRRGSVSSTSSLSSVPDDAIEGYDDFISSGTDDDDSQEASRMEGDQAKGHKPNKNGRTPAGATQPISVEQAKPASKKQIVSPDPVLQRTTPTHHSLPRSRDSSMPAAIITTPTSTLNTIAATTSITEALTNVTSQRNANRAIPTLKFPSRFGEPGDSTDTLVKKKSAQKSETTVNTKRVSEESFVRVPLRLDELPEEASSLPHLPALPTPSEHVRSSRTPAPVLSGRAARAAKRHHEDIDDTSSPTASFFRADPEPSSARNSRAATPSNPRSSKKPRGGLRVKTSPMKRKGTSAGIPRGAGDRLSPVGNGTTNNQDDNDDSCFTCGGNGELVCCDGCTFSFHFMCIDPPMDQGHVPDEWYCNECQIRYNPPLVNEHRGIFGPLAANLERKNPRAFRLPESLREYFEGVKTGAEGEYEEIAPPKPKTNKRNVDEPFDFFKIRNGDKAVLCHECHKGAMDNRPIIPCSVCGLNWHLECLSPPLAVPPVLRTWRCPCHVDDLLNDLPSRLAPAHKYRKIKNTPVIEQGYSRGLANNGWIEIQDDDSELDEAWRGHKSFGRVFRLSAKGIRKDFVSKVHQNRGTLGSQSKTAAVPSVAVTSGLPSLERQQAALNLLQLSQRQENGVDQLVQAMMSEASPAVISMMAQGDAQRIARGNLAKADVVTLEAMLAQADALRHEISKILEGRIDYGAHEKPETQPKALTPNSISQDDPTAVDELRLDRTSSPGSGSAQDAVRPTKPSQDDSSMQID